MNILFRVDGSIEIGGGHIMRCIALAQKFKAYGANCSFICKVHDGNYISLIRGFGFNVYELSLKPEKISEAPSVGSEKFNYQRWLGSDWKFDADQTILKIKDIRVDCLVIDHYSIDDRWERRLKSYCSLIFVIDDLADRPHVCDLLLDQNMGRKKSEYKNLLLPACEVLIGPRYALLRDEFYRARSKALERRGDNDSVRILVTMGAIDKDNFTKKILKSISSSIYFKGLNITVVLGSNSPWIMSIKRFVSKLSNVNLVVNPANMSELMVGSDIAISAGGSTTWELCCLALPVLIVVTAENQVNSAGTLKAMGAVELVGVNRIPTDLVKYLDGLLKNYSQRHVMSVKASKIADGKGCDGVYRVIKASLHSKTKRI